MFKMRKRLMIGVLGAVMAVSLLVPASAHGGHGHGRGHHSRVQTGVAVCPYDDCTLAGRHLHDGVSYCGYDHESGVCNGKCRALCPYEDCSAAGLHDHDGTTYCGSSHSAGFCDAGCRCAHGCKS